MKFLPLATLFFLFAGCNSTGDTGKQTVKTRADSLMDEVMKNHNIGMAKMDKIDEVQKRVQQSIDSISKLSILLQKKSKAYKIQLDSMLGRLKLANEAMENWMNEFNMDSSLNNMDERTKYLESEKTKISSVRDMMIASLQKADSLLKKK